MAQGANNFNVITLRQSACMLEKDSRGWSAMDLNKLLTVVIPTLNEESGVSRVIEELHSRGLTNIIVVDGHSQDQTVQISRELGARILYQSGKGKTGALLTAIRNVSTPYMLVMDGDFSYDADSISKLVTFMPYYDEVIGARVPISSKSMTVLHRLGNSVITKLFNVLMGTNLTDVCSGMYIINTAVANKIQLATAGFDVEAEIVAKIACIGSIKEVNINYRPRIGTQKLSTWRHGFRIIRSILSLARSQNPGIYYPFLGALTIVPAALILANSNVELISSGPAASPFAFAGVSMVLCAIQATGVGINSLIQRRSELRYRSGPSYQKR